MVLISNKRFIVSLGSIGAITSFAAMPVALASPAHADTVTHTNAVSETGSSEQSAAPYVVPANVKATVNAKLKMLDNVNHGRSALSGVSLSGTHGLMSASSPRMVRPHSQPPEGGSGLHIFYEGQGNGNKHYTCGPSATRNMIYNFIGKDYGEHQFEVWEGTTSTSGTSIGNIASTLNGHFSAYGGWTVLSPSSTSSLSNAINLDVNAGQETIQNVRTNYLSFWGGHSTTHYDNSYAASGGQIYVAEEWNPSAIGLSVNYRNPYGFHGVAGSEDYNAVQYSPTGSIVY